MARLAQTSRALVTVVVLRALLRGVAVLSVALAALALLDLVVPLPLAARLTALPLVLLAAVLVTRRAWRAGRGARSPLHVALWIEERVPALRYALATLADTRSAATTSAAATSATTFDRLEAIVSNADWSQEVRRASLRSLARPLVLIIVSAVMLVLLPGAAVTRVAAPRRGDHLDAAGAARARGSILSPLVGVVTPPAYTGRRAVTIDEPASLAGIAGSEVVLRGRGNASRIRALLGDTAVRAATEGDRWSVRFTMPATARALRLADGAAERVVTIEPWPDSLPVVVLRTPARDTVFREPGGSIALAAELADDIGLADARFEYIITSGEMESFTFRTGAAARTAQNGARTAMLGTTLQLGGLGLKPGDIIHLRAVATDGNTATGPGRGTSETRTIRIARLGEYDSVSIEAMPSIMGDTAALSQRMLIMLAEALERRRPRLVRDTVVAESRDIARDQARLRRRVADIVFMRVSGETPGEEAESDEDRPTTPEEVLAAAESVANRDANATLDFSEDESPVVAVNRPLLEAYNAMWEAGRWLEIGEPDDALPHMRAALAAIQRARQAERIYLRGRPPTQVVDVRDARLKGDRASASGSGRLPGAALGMERSRLAARLGIAASLARTLPSAAADSLLLLRLSALERYPAFASVLGRAASRLRAGDDASGELLRARDALLGEARHTAQLPAWSGAP